MTAVMRMQTKKALIVFDAYLLSAQDVLILLPNKCGYSSLRGPICMFITSGRINGLRNSDGLFSIETDNIKRTCAC